MAVSVDDGTISVYVNGEIRFTGDDFPNVFTNTHSNFSLGVNWWDAPFKGLMDHLQIFEGALTPGQIAELLQNNN